MTRSGGAVRRAVVVALVYVLPLGLTAAFLASVGLGLLAVALLAVEACVVLAVSLARRRPQGPARTHDGSTVLLVLGAVVVVVVGALVLRAR